MPLESDSLAAVRRINASNVKEDKDKQRDKIAADIAKFLSRGKNITVLGTGDMALNHNQQWSSDPKKASSYGK